MANFPFNISKSAWKAFISKNLPASLNDVSIGSTGGKAGFYGTTPITKPAALTAPDASTVDGTYGAEEAAVLANVRTRVNELETKLKALGLIS